MQKNREIILTSDGSKTIYFPDIDENYHSNHGALQESVHVYIQNGLANFSDLKEVSVFEMGFGTGLNALLSLIYAIENNQVVSYQTIEAFPISEKEIEELNYGALVSEEYQGYYKKLHQKDWDKSNKLVPNFDFRKHLNEIQNFNLGLKQFDCIFYDAFAPKIQPDLWMIDIFQKMYDSLNENGLLVTYCAQGQVKRDLKACGFTIENVPGPPGKREITLAWKFI